MNRKMLDKSTNVGPHRIGLMTDCPTRLNLYGAHFVLIDKAKPIVVIDNKPLIIENCIFEFQGDQKCFPECVTFYCCVFINCDNLPNEYKMINCYVTTGE